MKEIKIKIDGLNFYYQQKIVLRKLNGEFEERAITTILGPSGVGKTTFLMILNRLYESIPDCRVEGKAEMKLNGGYVDIHSLPLTTLRKKVGMVFQMPNPLPMSIFKNVAFPLKLSGIKDRKHIEQKVEEALKYAFLWDEVKDRLNDSALKLSGGQQQRLCIARAMIIQPEVLLLDEPTSSLDVKAALKIEELLESLKERCTLIIVSHYADQTKRITDNVLILEDGRFRDNDSLLGS
jgi:phosphate ABC transporter ATP-binding protein, PhoT family (TC 3.A.1.7.1)